MNIYENDKNDYILTIPEEDVIRQDDNTLDTSAIIDNVVLPELIKQYQLYINTFEVTDIREPVDQIVPGIEFYVSFRKPVKYDLSATNNHSFNINVPVFTDEDVEKSGANISELRGFMGSSSDKEAIDHVKTTMVTQYKQQIMNNNLVDILDAVVMANADVSVTELKGDVAPNMSDKQFLHDIVIRNFCIDRPNAPSQEDLDMYTTTNKIDDPMPIVLQQLAMRATIHDYLVSIHHESVY